MRNDQLSAQTKANISHWNLSKLGIELYNPRWWFESFCIAFAYFASSWFASGTIFSVLGPSSVWPGAGLNAGLILTFGRSRWFGVFIGILFYNLHRNWLKVFVPALGASIGSTIGTLITVSLILKFTQNTRYPFLKARHVVTFALCAMFSGTIFQSITGVAIYTITRRYNEADFITNLWLPWWIGDSVGVLIFAALAITWLRPEARQQIKPQFKSYLNWEILAAFLSITIVAYFSFYEAQPLEYLLLPPLLWSAFRFEPRLTTLLVMFVSLTASIATANGFGVFHKVLSARDSLLLLQIFMGVIALTTLVTTAIVHENNQANLSLQRINAELEQRVLGRTLDLQQSEAKALELAAKAEAASQAKSTFIANMSHELRSPLNAVIGFSQLMMRTSNVPLEHYENASIIHRSGEYLLTLINNILDLSKIEAGKTTLNINNFDLDHLLGDIEDMLQLRATDAGLSLIFEQASDLPRYICTDETKLRQVLINLLGNAIKFTNNGSIHLSVTTETTSETSSETTSDDTCILNFCVRDTGVGIAEEEIGKLFTSFNQAKAGREKQEGTGLGLAISRRFVQMMGGDITVTSELGKGTEFRFQIQAQRGQAMIAETNLPKRALSLAANQPTYRILVVDDKPVNCKLLIRLLAPMGFEVKEAHNGQEAIAMWEVWEPNLIWMDMRMPVMDGYEATKYIKSTTKGNATAVIALTASVLEEEKAIVLSAGCDDFIRKPFNEQTILDTLAKHLGVTYVYDQSPEQFVFQSSNETVLTPETLTSYCQEMPISWKRNLYIASLEADRSRFMDLLAELPDPNSHVGRSLTKLARNFQFEQLVDLLEPISK